MADYSEQWNIEVVPGAKRVKQAAGFVKRIAMLGTQTELCLSGHIVDRVDTGAAAMLDQSLEEPAQLPFPGQVGGVHARPVYRSLIDAEADAIIRGDL